MKNKLLHFFILILISPLAIAQNEKIITPEEMKSLLSAQGYSAYNLLLENENYYGGLVGIGAKPSNQQAVKAFNDVLLEKESTAAFISLLSHAKIGGQLFALNGLHYLKDKNFEKYVLPYKNSIQKIHFHSGCTLEDEEITISTIIKSIVAGNDDRLIQK